jgi:hypothetical protein
MYDFTLFVFVDKLQLKNDNQDLSVLKRWIDLLWDVHYRRQGGCPMALFMFMQVIMLHIFFSPRFESVVMALWVRRDIFMEFYFQLYFYFVCAVTIVVCTFTPLLELLLPWIASWISTLGIVTQILGWINYILYIFVANVVLYIFFKTNYRVATVAEYRPLKRTRRFLGRRPFDLVDDNGNENNDGSTTRHFGGGIRRRARGRGFHAAGW